ncbi:alkaline phosphatase [Lysobacter pythonis]|uniref:Alkaline phosphatase n=1 Tax=Solilutibacter pythonis TaxID=2483112 RepID=A0A3M2I182_9GAMM|nr:alkaline phosphatase [Lysobacter pythonis]RMH92942.1 alkaline phosphatase [Lysobacter pythonis]
MPHVPPSITPLLAALAATVLSACAAGAPTRASAPAIHVDVPSIQRPDGETPAWWFRHGAAQASQRGATAGRAKNLILFVGDGMSLPTVAAARILEGQRAGRPGEEQKLAWEEFPATALSRTYNTNAQTPDSAGTMTAMATGVKTRMGVLSIGQDAPRGDCAAARKSPMLTLWELAAANGLSTGVITTTRVTHATPGATFSHSADRNWESDTDLPQEARDFGCHDIARQMIESDFGNGPDVLMGGGRKNFMPVDQRDPEYDDKVGERLDGRDLIAQWKSRHPEGAYVWNARQLAEAPANAPLLGLFEPDHMHYEHDRPQDKAGEPTLAEMTRAAIARLRSNPEGYVLLVEGGRIDHAHHEGNAYRALVDTIALSDAVRTATEMTDEADTLILVTADHAHTMNFVGYPARGNPILGKVKGGSGEDGDPTQYARDATGLPYTTLNYANGPGYAGANDQQTEGPKRANRESSGWQVAERGRPDLTDIDTEHPDYLQESMIPMRSETHGGDDVGIWARGPGSQAVRGSVEQNTIFHFLLQAHPRLRKAVCDTGHCNAGGVPTELPSPGKFATPVKR